MTLFCYLRERKATPMKAVREQRWTEVERVVSEFAHILTIV